MKKWIVFIPLLVIAFISLMKPNEKQVLLETVQNQIEKELFYDAALTYDKLYRVTKEHDYLFLSGEQFEKIKAFDEAIVAYEELRQKELKNARAYQKLEQLYRDHSDLNYVQLIYDKKQYLNDDSSVRKIENSFQVDYKLTGDIIRWENEYGVYQQNNVYGVVDDSGFIVLPAEYNWIGHFDTQLQLFLVKKGDELLYVDFNGYKRKHVDLNVKQFGPWIEGVRWIETNTGFAFQNQQFHIIADGFEAVGNFRHNIAPVKKNHLWGFINQKGELIQSFQYESILMDDNRVANEFSVIWVKYKGEWQLLDNTFKKMNRDFVIQPKLFLSEQPCAVELSAGWNFMTREGNVLSEKRYLETQSFNYEHTFVKTEPSLWKICNILETLGEAVVCDTISHFDSKRYAKFKLNEQIGYVKLFHKEG